jgi:polysaccharide export outer membrane protein
MTTRVLLAAGLIAVCLAGRVAAQVAPKPVSPPAQAPAQVPPVGITPPADYVIGADDVLTIVFWREKDLSGDVTVRPDGIISVPLINEIKAAGLTPDQLRQKLVEAAAKYIADPNAVVVVKQINSRKVFITGMVNKIGAHPLTAPMTVLQLIATAGGLVQFADEENIVVVRTEKGRQVSYRFNYKEVSKRKKLEQNIWLQPGDQVIVP